jgi:plastocyanin
MHGHAIRRASVVVGIGLSMGVALTSAPAIASGGGGCGQAVSDRAGTRVRIQDYCFGPTILRVQAGQTVTWVNRDGWKHTVLGANAVWGAFDSIRGTGGRVSYRFVRSGVYPYVCTYHPGMIGAVVVGNGFGRGAANATTTSTGPVVPVAPSPIAEPVVMADRAAPSSGSTPALVASGVGALLLGAAAFTLGRRRRVPAA